MKLEEIQIPADIKSRGGVKGELLSIEIEIDWNITRNKKYEEKYERNMKVKKR